MTLQAGDALLMPDADNEEARHLWIIISDPLRHPQQVLIVNVTTWEKLKEDTCILEPAECESCPFIKHTSCIDYRRATIEPSSRIENWLETGTVSRQATISRDLLEKIRKGAQESRFLPNKCELFLADQGLIEL